MTISDIVNGKYHTIEDLYEVAKASNFGMSLYDKEKGFFHLSYMKAGLIANKCFISTITDLWFETALTFSCNLTINKETKFDIYNVHVIGLINNNGSIDAAYYQVSLDQDGCLHFTKTEKPEYKI